MRVSGHSNLAGRVVVLRINPPAAPHPFRASIADASALAGLRAPLANTVIAKE
jgi:hypothetical protein